MLRYSNSHDPIYSTIDVLRFVSQPFTFHFPRADIHEMLSADLLHQLIKGTFKDHLVQWVGDYLYSEHGEAQANNILDQIDRRYTNFLPH